MMDADAADGSGAGAIPARIKDVEAGLGHGFELDQGEIDIEFGRAKDGAALVLGQRTAWMAGRATRGVVVPVNHHGRRIGPTDAAMVGGEEIRFEIARDIGYESAGTGKEAFEGIDTDTADFIAPRGCLRA